MGGGMNGEMDGWINEWGTWRWGLGSQGMHTSNYTYHLREGKEPKEGVPGADGGKRRSY